MGGVGGNRKFSSVRIEFKTKEFLLSKQSTSKRFTDNESIVTSHHVHIDITTNQLIHQSLIILDLILIRSDSDPI